MFDDAGPKMRMEAAECKPKKRDGYGKITVAEIQVEIGHARHDSKIRAFVFCVKNIAGEGSVTAGPENT